MKTRLTVFGIIFGLGVLGLISRLFFWQIIQASELSKQGQLQYQRSNILTAKRGSIFAADGGWWTTDENDWTLFAMKTELKTDPRTIANELAPLLVSDEKDHDKVLTEAMKVEGVLNGNG